MTTTQNNPRTSANARQLVSFYDLPEEWQKEAKSNLDEYAEETTYVMPRKRDKVGVHILWDLHECMASSGEFDGIIPISNCCAMGIVLSDCGDYCWLTHI